ncbi:MAG: hypothetical protein AAFX93_04085 [Verrucomicrobiota bacterium]
MYIDPKHLGWFIGLCLALLITWMLNRQEPPEPVDLVPLAKESPKPPPAVDKPIPPPGTVAPANPAVRRLHDPTRSAEDDVKLMNQFLVQMRASWMGKLRPMGINEEFTAALTGKNPAKMAFIPKDHPAINAEGQLTDRWGEPYHFHVVATDRVEVRSAGPDRRLYTDDDAVFAPWGKRPDGEVGP